MHPTPPDVLGTLLALAVGALAIVFELVPERVDFVGFVLAAAGLGSLVGSFYGWRRDVTRAQRAIYAEDFALLFAATATLLFVGMALIQGVV